MSTIDKYWSFIIDTNSYSGNFEREMTAYVTGAVGDCEVGYQYAEEFKEEEPDSDIGSIIYQKSNENGIYRPCEIATTPGRVNNGTGVHMDADADEVKNLKQTWPAYESVEIFFSEDPSPHIDMMKERAVEFASFKDIKVVGFRLNVTETTVSVVETYV